jgi:hypothetical protein
VNDTTALHEAAHATTAHVLGEKVLGVTVRPGERFAGCALWSPARPPGDAVDGLDVGLPFVLWPAAVRQWMEHVVVFLMAGDVAEQHLAPLAGRQADPVSERAVEIAAELPPPTNDDLAKFAAVTDDTEGKRKTDAEEIAAWALLAHGKNGVVSTTAWLRFLEAQTTDLVVTNADRIRRLAAVLDAAEALSGEQVAAVLRDH